MGAVKAGQRRVQRVRRAGRVGVLAGRRRVSWVRVAKRVQRVEREVGSVAGRGRGVVETREMSSERV